jgi:hypothetical protein
MAREVLLKTTSEQQSHSYAVICGMLSPMYFKCILSLELAQTCDLYDSPFIWHTQRGDRKKVIGQYVLVMKNELALSSNQCMVRVMQQNLTTVAVEQRIPTRARTDNELSPLEWIPNLKKGHLHDALMEIPYNLNTECDRPRGQYISLLHVIVYAIVDKCTRSESEPLSLKILSGKIRFKKQIQNIYMSLENPHTPFPPIVNGPNFHLVASTRVHLLWGSQDAFTQSIINVRRSVHEKLSRTTYDKQFSSNAFRLEEFQNSVMTFEFSNESAISVYRMITCGGVFDSLTLKKVEELKVICHLIKSANGVGKNKGTDKEWKTNKKKVLLGIMKGCQNLNDDLIRETFHRYTASTLTTSSSPSSGGSGTGINDTKTNSTRTITPDSKRQKRN